MRARVGDPARWLRELKKAVSWNRRLLGAGLLAGSVALTISALSPAAPDTVRVVVAARDVPGGTTLGRDHAELTQVPAGSVPAGALTTRDAWVGRVLAAPVRQGEVLTDVRLVGASLVESYGDRFVAVPVRVADAASAALLRPGDVIDVLAAAAPEVPGDPAVVRARVVASAVPVLTLVEQRGGGFGGTGIERGALLVVASTPETAAVLASAAVTSRLSVTIRATR